MRVQPFRWFELPWSTTVSYLSTSITILSFKTNTVLNAFCIAKSESLVTMSSNPKAVSSAALLSGVKEKSSLKNLITPSDNNQEIFTASD